MTIVSSDSLSLPLSIAAERVGFEPTSTCVLPVFKTETGHVQGIGAALTGTARVAGDGRERSRKTLSVSLSGPTHPWRLG